MRGDRQELQIARLQCHRRVSLRKGGVGRRPLRSRRGVATTRQRSVATRRRALVHVNQQEIYATGGAALVRDPAIARSTGDLTGTGAELSREGRSSCPHVDGAHTEHEHVRPPHHPERVVVVEQPGERGPVRPIEVLLEALLGGAE